MTTPLEGEILPNKKAGSRGVKLSHAGRKKGVPNKNTTMLKEAILLAAAQVGDISPDENGKSPSRGKGKLTGYLRFAARHEPKAFLSLLGRVIPTQLVDENDIPIPIQRIEIVGVTPEQNPEPEQKED